MATRNIGPSCWADRTGFDQVIEDRDALYAEVERLQRDQDEIREMVGAQDDETTVDAVRDMMDERKHYVRETNTAHEQTIPGLTAEIERLRDAHARCTNLTNAEASRIFEEARQMREERDHWRTLAEQYVVERDAYRRTLADLMEIHPARIVAPVERPVESQK